MTDSTVWVIFDMRLLLYFLDFLQSPQLQLIGKNVVLMVDRQVDGEEIVEYSTKIELVAVLC